MTGALVAGAVVLAFAGAWQLAGAHGEGVARSARRALTRVTAGRAGTLAEAALALGVPERLGRAGLAGRVSPAVVLAGKGAGAIGGLAAASVALPALPGRLQLVAAPLLAVAGFLAPDALLDRTARLRRARLVASLPDALDLLAVGAASGRAPAAVMREISARGAGPLAEELAITVAELDCGTGQAEALAGLRERVPGGELGALGATIERSRRYGSPLAEQLSAQASALRADAARRVEEAASRSAPKIQLVVALVLVPSVLLMILAAILAHSGALRRSLR